MLKSKPAQLNTTLCTLTKVTYSQICKVRTSKFEWTVWNIGHTGILQNKP